MPKTFHDFGTVCVGEHHKLQIPITNSGALGTRYVIYEKGHYDEVVLKASQTSDSLVQKVNTNTDDISFFTNPSDISVNENMGKGSFVAPTIFLQVESFDLEPQIEEIVVSQECRSGFIPEFATENIEIQYMPKVVAKHSCQYVVVFEDSRIDPINITFVANTIDLPVYVERPEMYIKYCMTGRLYQDSVMIYNRATSALRIRFEIPTELRQHFDMLPQIGVVQANSSFSAQFKFIPLESIFDDCAQYFDEDQLLRIPVNIRVADQTRPVAFVIKAHVTKTDVTFSTNELDFGPCSIYESVRMPFEIKNHCLLPQMYGFVSLPEFVTIQPNDGFGTLLPGKIPEI